MRRIGPVMGALSLASHLSGLLICGRAVDVSCSIGGVGLVGEMLVEGPVRPGLVPGLLLPDLLYQILSEHRLHELRRAGDDGEHAGMCSPQLEKHACYSNDRGAVPTWTTLTARP